jgi:integrase
MLLTDVSAEMLSRFAAELRKEDKSPETVRCYLAHIRPALNWAVDMDLLKALPKFPRSRRKGGDKAKGRALTLEEFERMLVAVPKVRPSDPIVWQRYLKGLWLSGLRLEESLAFSWEPNADISARLDGELSMIQIKGRAQKSGRDQLCPMPPDLVEFLENIPEADRRGRVFKLDGLLTREPIVSKSVSRIVSDIGKAAGIVVRRRVTTRGAEKLKYASAHDLRRSFGTRWAPKMMPVDLQQLMRHANISTTMEYYVDIQAEDIAARLWKAHYGNDSATAARSGVDREANAVR